MEIYIVINMKLNNKIIKIVLFEIKEWEKCYELKIII